MSNDFLKKMKGFHVIPFGGCSIGMSLYAYVCDGEWILVDMGVGFQNGSSRTILVPDPSVLVEMKDHIKALVLTHMHEDHIGAIPYLWPLLNPGTKIYSMPIVREMIREKMRDFNVSNVPFVTVEPHKDLRIGKFRIKYIPVAHSTPEACALSIKTKYGHVVHSGDWRFDDAPVLGFTTDAEDFKKLGNDDVMAFLCDSTNVSREDPMGCEKEVRQNLIELVKSLKGRGVAITCFASNVARIESCYMAAKESGRKMAIMGRSLGRIEDISRKCGYLKGVPQFLTEKQAAKLKPEEVLMVCTGSQGEVNAALSKLAYGARNVEYKLKRGDALIFSSRTIPGNEKAVIAMQGAFISRGIEIFNDSGAEIHASGHASRSEIKKMYSLLRPNCVIPMHGELGNLHNHAAMAAEYGIENTLVPQEGAVIRLKKDDFEIEEFFEIKTLLVDGRQLVPVDGDICKERESLLEAGVVVLSVTFNNKTNKIHCDDFSFVGIFEKDESDEKKDVCADITAGIGLIGTNGKEFEYTNKNIEKEITKIIKNVLADTRGIDPTVIVHVIDVK